MGLFSILAPSAATTTTTTAESSSTLSVPTVIQLYTGTPVVWSSSNNAVKTPKYAVLSYQAVEVGPPEGDKTTVTTTTTHPNLGVWNCRVPKSTTPAASDQQPLVDYLLKIPSSSSSSTTKASSPTTTTICFTVDLSNLSTVEPTISLLQDALVRFLIAQQEQQQGQPLAPAAGEDGEAASSNKTATTTLFQLKSTQFGLAKEDEESAAKMLTNTPEPKDRLTTVALMICAVLPTAKGPTDADGAKPDEYKEKQSHALVLYHLRRYAAKLNACLVFVQEKEKDSAADVPAPASEESAGGITDQHVPVSLEELSYTWQQFAQGKEVWKEEDTSVPPEGESKEGDETAAAATSSAEDIKIFGPGKHQEDLIESVLMRSANYPGNWDASKDSLWKALPDTTTSDNAKQDDEPTKKKKTDEDDTGDQVWLGQLRDSTAVNEAPTKTPPVKKSTSKKKKDAKTPGDEEVTDFFASLMKT